MFPDGFRHHHRAVASTGTSEGNGQITFTFANVVRDQIGEQTLDASKKLRGLRKRTDVSPHFRVLTGKFAQARNEMRIRQKTDVEDEVGVGGDAVAKSKADHGNHERTLVRVL